MQIEAKIPYVLNDSLGYLLSVKYMVSYLLQENVGMDKISDKISYQI